MWSDLPEEKKEEYKRLILAFASLTGMFAQKSYDNDSNVSPIINSKFQETAFQKAFDAYAEDIGNTSYDVSLEENGEKYLVGIKTFGISSGDQKVAQFKAKHDEWAEIIEKIKENASGADDKDAINLLNTNLYMILARRIAMIRNARIDSSRANIRGFKVKIDDSHVHSVYHVLMPSGKNEEPKIFVGETAYDKIDIENLSIIGCTGKNNPTNFFFTDGKHVYKYTSADSQLHMNFDNKNIVCDEWDVKYADDAHAIFGKIADVIYPENKELSVSGDKVDFIISKDKFDEPVVEESYCWTIWNKNREVELFSGFNSFYGTGSKMQIAQRIKKIDSLDNLFNDCDEAFDSYNVDIANKIKQGVKDFLLKSSATNDARMEKVKLRNELIELADKVGSSKLTDELKKILYRPMNEVYISIPDAKSFHKEHPYFFGSGYGEVKDGSHGLRLPKEERQFNLVFEPSGDSLPAYITQDEGKAIESVEKQSYLGEWILREVFQLGEYEPLTTERLEELNINGIRLTRYRGSKDIHLEFIWIDEENPPKGYISGKR